VELIPALIAANVEEFHRKLTRVAGLGEWLHVDFVDGEFAGSATVTPEELAGIPFRSRLEIHLMVADPADWVGRLAPLQPGRVFTPVESTRPVADLAHAVHGLGAEFGLAINPATPIETLARELDSCDRALVLGVQPGRQGQRFRPETTERVARVRRSAAAPIEVDGGVGAKVIAPLVAAGATSFALGSYLQDSSEPRSAYERLARVALEHRATAVT
jgi:ribulose-phosphate 3-epimerase